MLHQAYLCQMGFFQMNPSKFHSATQYLNRKGNTYFTCKLRCLDQILNKRVQERKLQDSCVPLPTIPSPHPNTVRRITEQCLPTWHWPDSPKQRYLLFSCLFPLSACQPVKQQPSVTIRKTSPLIKALKYSEQRSSNIKNDDNEGPHNLTWTPCEFSGLKWKWE